MIITETYDLNGRPFVRTYSDANRYVVRDGISYSEANDPAEFNRTYTEGDLMTAEEIEDSAQEILDILTGGTE